MTTILGNYKSLDLCRDGSRARYLEASNFEKKWQNIVFNRPRIPLPQKGVQQRESGEKATKEVTEASEKVTKKEEKR